MRTVGGSSLSAVCLAGRLVDNMKGAITTILRGKERDFNRRYEELSSHYLFEPVACTPPAGWEKGREPGGHGKEAAVYPKASCRGPRRIERSTSSLSDFG